MNARVTHAAGRVDSGPSRSRQVVTGGRITFPLYLRSRLQGGTLDLTGGQRVLWVLGLVVTLAVWRVGIQGLPAVGAADAGVSMAEPEAEGPVERPFYGKRLEPREPVVLLGGGPSNEAGFQRYSEALGPNRPMLTSTSLDLRDDLPGFFARLRGDLHVSLTTSDQPGAQTLLVPQIGLSLNAGDASRHYERQVGAGAEDARLEQLIVGLRSLDRPVFLRVGYDSNDRAEGYDPAAYVSAFRHIAARIRGAGLQQVALVWDWSPDAELDVEENGARDRDAEERWLAFYPGDDVVDWWGLSLFNQEGITAPITARFLAAADRRGFPVMIGASTPKGHETSEGALVVDGWYRPYFQLIGSSRAIKAFCYLDRDWRPYPQWASWGDGRLEANAAVLSYTRAELSRPLYAGLRERVSTEALLGLQ